MAIPVVDLADFLSGEAQRKAEFVQKLGKAYEDVGFVAVKNHGIPDELIEDLYKYVHNSSPCVNKKQLWGSRTCGPAAILFGKDILKEAMPRFKEFFSLARW